MYRIYLDDNLLHDVYIKDLKIYNPKAILEQNGIGSFEFTIYPNHPLNNAIKPLKSLVTIFQCGFLIFRGRVLEIETTTKNEKSIYCEGELGFLCDTVQEPYNYQGSVSRLFQQVIDKHNSQVDTTKQFKVGNITVIDKNDYIVREDKSYLSTWETIKKKFIELMGGYIQVRHEQDGNYIDYLADFTTENTQHVIFGENMLSVKRTDDNADIGTVLIPLGATDDKTEERLTIASVNNGKIYIENTQNLAKYGRIVKVATWDDVTVAENLKNKAIELLNEMGKKVDTIEISAIDMASINKDISNFRMHQKIKVISSFHGINDYFTPMKMNVSLFNPKSNKITLNGTIKTLTGANTNNQVEISKLMQTVQKVEFTNQSLPTQIGSLQEEICNNKKQTDSQIKDLDTQIQTLDAQIKLVDGSNKQLDLKVNKLDKDVANISLAFENMNKNNVDWTSLQLMNFKECAPTTKPEYCVKEGIVEVRGSISPLTTHTSNETKEVFAAIPQEIAPKKTVNRLCQGNSKATWLLTVETNGELTVSRYGTNTYEEIPSDACLIFDELYKI